jgi:hypothetical protein
MLHIDEDRLMDMRPRCPCCRKRNTRIVLPSTSWNQTGQYLLHCKLTGKVTPIDDIEALIRREEEAWDAGREREA